MSLFGSSPPEEPVTPSKSSHSQSLFNDERATGAASSSLFNDSPEDGASPWNMPTPKKAGRSQLVRNLLPADSVPESYVDAFDTLVESDYRMGSGLISLAGARKIFEGSGLDAAEQSKIINLVANGQESSNGLSRSEFNVLVALSGLALEKEDITLDGVDERRRSIYYHVLTLLTFQSVLTINRSPRAIFASNRSNKDRKNLPKYRRKLTAAPRRHSGVGSAIAKRFNTQIETAAERLLGKS